MEIKEKKSRFFYAVKINHFSKKRNLIGHRRIQKEYFLFDSDFQYRKNFLGDEIGINKEYSKIDSPNGFTQDEDIA
jgi:hypothetical protein